MDINVRKQDSVHVVRLKGPFRLGQQVDEFRQVFDGLLVESPAHVVLNLAEVPSADSSGIGALVKVQTMARQKGGAVKLVSPATFVAQTLKLVGVLNIFEVHASEADAVASFASH